VKTRPRYVTALLSFWSATMSPVPYLGVFLGLLGAFGPVPPRQKEEPPPILSVRTELVTLPVTVIDRRGRFVTGLRQEDFTVYDGGERRTIEFFTGEDMPATIGLVIDSSSSMRDRREHVTTAATAFGASSHPLDEFFTINFNEAVWPGLPPSIAFTEDRDQLRAALSVAPARGMTALYDAIDRALGHLQLGTRDRRALIVVSDGGDNASSGTLDAVLDGARRTGAVIYTVTLWHPDDRDARPRVMKRLARETGGEAFTPARADDVIGAFAQIAREIRSGYTIGFVPPATADGGFRSIQVVVDAGDRRHLVARTRAGYHAGASGRTVR
jgi:Ca-activated chloride channel family protein